MKVLVAVKNETRFEKIGAYSIKNGIMALPKGYSIKIEGDEL